MESNIRRENLRDVKLRKNVRNLSTGEIRALRESFESSYEFGDERGYAHFAGIHGLPLPIYCQHGTPLFFPWHRAYLYFFEQ